MSVHPTHVTKELPAWMESTISLANAHQDSPEKLVAIVSCLLIQITINLVWIIEPKSLEKLVTIVSC